MTDKGPRKVNSKLSKINLKQNGIHSYWRMARIGKNVKRVWFSQMDRFCIWGAWIGYKCTCWKEPNWDPWESTKPNFWQPVCSISLTFCQFTTEEIWKLSHDSITHTSHCAVCCRILFFSGKHLLSSPLTLISSIVMGFFFFFWDWWQYGSIGQDEN